MKRTPGTEMQRAEQYDWSRKIERHFGQRMPSIRVEYENDMFVCSCGGEVLRGESPDKLRKAIQKMLDEREET